MPQTDVLFITPGESAAGTDQLNNALVGASDLQYGMMHPVLKAYYEKIRENLGTACLTAYLRDRGYTVQNLYMHGRSLDAHNLRTVLRRSSPRIVGISIMYDLHLRDAIAIAELASREFPDALLMLGGAFCTYNADILAENLPFVDCVAVGEAEITLASLLQALDAGKDWRGIRGLAFSDAGRVTKTGAPELPDLLAVPPPSRDLLEEMKRAGVPTPNASSYTSRGCHAKCTFCYAPNAPGAKAQGFWRVRDPAQIAEEIERLKRDFGTRFIWFNDDNFSGVGTAGVEHATALAEEFIRRDLGIEFHCEFRVDSGLLDQSIVKLMRRAGMRSVLFGLETGSPSVARRMRKGATIASNRDAVDLLSKSQIHLDPGWIMVDADTTLNELWENYYFIVSTGIHRLGPNPIWLFNRAIVLRGTEMFTRVEAKDPDPGEERPVDIIDRILGQTRKDYQFKDPRVGKLWETWSPIAVDLVDKVENQLPFLLSELTRQRQAGGESGAAARTNLRLLAQWRRDLPKLFLSLLATGLNLAEKSSTAGKEGGLEMPALLGPALSGLVERFDQERLGAPFAHFRDRFEANAFA